MIKKGINGKQSHGGSFVYIASAFSALGGMLDSASETQKPPRQIMFQLGIFVSRFNFTR